MKNLMILISFLLSLSIQASFIASNKNKIQANLPTHILVAGSPDKLGNLFIYSLLTKANVYSELNPEAQIIIIGRSEDKDEIKQSGFKIIENKMGQLKAGLIKDVIKYVKQVNSLDVFAHSNAMNGATLDSNSWVYQLLNEKDELWSILAPKMSDSSFVFIYGCNAGVKFAPLVAKKIKRAVYAALTSTDFQYIYPTNTWGFDYDFKEEKRVAKNAINFSEENSCGKYCTRMKPDNFSYRGYWGDWSQGGYPTYKLFCGSNENESCKKGALNGLISFPGVGKVKDILTTKEEYKKHLIDFMCPFAFDAEKQNGCRETLEKAEQDETLNTYSPFKGNTLVCDRVSCKAHFNCPTKNAIFNPSACELISESKEESTVFVEEYKYLLNLYPTK